MEIDDIIKNLESGGIEVSSVRDLNNGSGTQIRGATGEIISIYKTGKIVPQGRNTEKVRRILFPESEIVSLRVQETPKPFETEPSRTVFVVYGHNVDRRNELEATLRRWGLNPLILDQMPSEGETIIEKLEKYIDADVHFGIVLATADDIGGSKENKNHTRPRARQNVVLELGMLLAHLGRKRVAILLEDIDGVEGPSDIKGLIYIPFRHDLRGTPSTDLAKRLHKVGIDIDLENL